MEPRRRTVPPGRRSVPAVAPESGSWCRRCSSGSALMAWQQLSAFYAVGDTGDPLFSVWRLSWVAHQLPRDPLHLFDANIFFPELRTLAYSDAMLATSLMAAPLLWLGVHQLVVYNTVLLLSFAASGVAMYALAKGTDRRPPGCAGGGRGVRLLPVPVRALQPPRAAGDLLDAAGAAHDAPHGEERSRARRRRDGADGCASDALVALLRAVPAGGDGRRLGVGRGMEAADGPPPGALAGRGGRRRRDGAARRHPVPAEPWPARRTARLGSAALQRHARSYLVAHGRSRLC